MKGKMLHHFTSLDLCGQEVTEHLILSSLSTTRLCFPLMQIMCDENTLAEPHSMFTVPYF